MFGSVSKQFWLDIQ